DSVAFEVERLACLWSNNQTADTSLNQQLTLPGFEVVGVETSRTGKNHLVARSRIRVLMKVETLAAGLIGETNDTMSSVRIDPFFGRLLRNYLNRASGNQQH